MNEITVKKKGNYYSIYNGDLEIRSYMTLTRVNQFLLADLNKVYGLLEQQSEHITALLKNVPKYDSNYINLGGNVVLKIKNHNHDLDIYDNDVYKGTFYKQSFINNLNRKFKIKLCIVSLLATVSTLLLSIYTPMLSILTS